MNARPQRRARRDVIALAIVCLLGVTLVGSVMIPALETRRIMNLLSEITHTIEPARVRSWELESGLSLEFAALQGYALSGDSVMLRQYHAVADRNTRLVTFLERLAPKLGPDAVESVADVSVRVERWHTLNRAVLNAELSRRQRALAVRGQRALRDSIIDAVERLPVALSQEVLAHREEVAAHERQGLLVNAALVFAALAALVVAIMLLRRQSSLTAILERRAEYEAALRETSEALAGAFTIDDVTDQIVRSALDVTRARRTWLERVESGPTGSALLVVRGGAGEGTPAIGTTQPYEGSPVAVALERGTPMHTTDGTIVLPIEQAGRPIGALSIAGAPGADLQAAEFDWARIFAHFAALAYEKVRLLDESRDARRELERVMASRERLIRGFSHDLKNPLGAADGYAALVADGIYGEVNATQRGSIESLRNSIRRALALIDDLHELARADTGVVALRREPVHVGELVRSLYEEYRGAAHASGLALGVDATSELPVLLTDGGRLRQIVGNLLSNAIKYTSAGSVTLRARSQSCTPVGDGGWIYVDVIDTGIGIPPDKRAVIFEEFSRLGNSDKPGAGLGLAISERLAEALGGRILVESEVGAGSTFTVQLPLVS